MPAPRRTGSRRKRGAAWIPKGKTQDLPLKALQANILCWRHNSALSPLDTMAGKLFRAVNEIYDDLSKRCPVSRSGISLVAKNWNYGF